jgi:probable rRNA maturation factor
MAVNGGHVSVISEGVRLPLPKARISRLAEKVLSILREKDAKACIFFVNDAKIRALNLKYRKIDRPTDCLAFPMREGAGGKIHREILGDIVISVDTAKKNSRYFGSAVKKEISLYVIHGILHLLGFKDTTVPARKKMREMEEGILKRL